jgi:hypothetical protein
MVERLWHYEFNQFDLVEVDGQMKMTMLDFCKSNLIYMSHNKIHQYIDRIKDKSDIQDKYVSFEEYVHWQYFIKHIDCVLDHVNEYRFISESKFKHMVSNFAKQWEKKSNLKF